MGSGSLDTVVGGADKDGIVVGGAPPGVAGTVGAGGWSKMVPWPGAVAEETMGRMAAVGAAGAVGRMTRMGFEPCC